MKSSVKLRSVGSFNTMSLGWDFSDIGEEREKKSNKKERQGARRASHLETEYLSYCATAISQTKTKQQQLKKKNGELFQKVKKWNRCPETESQPYGTCHFSLCSTKSLHLISIPLRFFFDLFFSFFFFFCESGIMFERFHRNECRRGFSTFLFFFFFVVCISPGIYWILLLWCDIEREEWRRWKSRNFVLCVQQRVREKKSWVRDVYYIVGW